MKTTLEKAAATLCELFPKTENNYSLGFNRMMSMSSKFRVNCQVALANAGYGWNSENTNELKKRLEAMTDQEFISFKKNKGIILLLNK